MTTMSMEIGRFTPSSAVAAYSRTTRFASQDAGTNEPAAGGVPARVDQVTFSVPATPPDEALDAVGRAAQVAEDLHASGRELHFGTHPETGRLTIELRDLQGGVLGTVSPGRALDLLAGEEV